MIFIEVNISVDQPTVPPHKIPRGKISIQGSHTLIVTQVHCGGGEDFAHEKKSYAPAGLREELSVPDTSSRSGKSRHETTTKQRQQRGEKMKSHLESQQPPYFLYSTNHQHFNNTIPSEVGMRFCCSPSLV